MLQCTKKIIYFSTSIKGQYCKCLVNLLAVVLDMLSSAQIETDAYTENSADCVTFEVCIGHKSGRRHT